MKDMTKIKTLIVMTVCSCFLGLFILPQEVSTTRWVEVHVSAEQAWREISATDNWPTWAPWSKGDKISAAIPWDDGVLSFREIDAENQTVFFDVLQRKSGAKGQGKLYVEKVPEGVWIRCQYEYEVDYAPWNRLSGWLHRGDVALLLDDGLMKLQQKLE